MSITKVLSDKTTSAESKLTEVAKMIAGIRETYGNTDLEILTPKVNGTHGRVSFTNLEDNSKVEVLLNQALAIKSKALAFVEENKGSVLNKKVQELLAINPFFANVSAGTEFELL